MDVISVLILTNPAGLRVKDKDGNLPLHSAIENGDKIPKSTLEKIVRGFPGACVIKDKEGNTPLHSAVENRVKDIFPIVQLLLAADPQGKSARPPDREGNLPIQSAAEKTGVPAREPPSSKHLSTAEASA